MRRLSAPLFVLLAVGLPAAGVSGAADYRLLKLEGQLVKWGEPRLGTPATVTYRLADRAETFPDAVNCRALAPFAALRVVGEGRVREVVGAAFAMWSAAAGVRFRPAAPGETPDILVGAQGEPDHIAFANVWTDEARAADGIAPLRRATICLNPELVWVPDAAGPGRADFGTVLAHEIGHTIGLDHPGPTGALMGYSDEGDVDALMAGDREGAIRLYGPAED